jgi:dynein heavy chain
MRETVRHEMSEAIASAEEKAREAWIFEPPAQVALCSVQIWWTVEVNIAFQRLEEGYENALKDFNKKQVCRLRSRCAQNCACAFSCFFLFSDRL